MLALHVNRWAERLPWPIGRRLNRLVPPSYGYYFVFLQRPLVVLIPEDIYDDPPHWEPLFQAVRSSKVHFLCMVRGAVEDDPEGYPQRIARVVAAHRQRFPGHTLTFLANNAAQTSVYEAAGLPHLHVNQNAYVDETVFTVKEDEEREFDAVYNAFSAPFKRHHLAHAVERLALVTYVRGTESEGYFRDHTAAMPGARWLNFPPGPPELAAYRSIPPRELAVWLNRARVGLCLSAREGAMFASMEYLLCGLPVVTTRSSGGRDVFFDPEHTLTVDDDAQAVAQGVREMAARRIDPHAVRVRALGKVGEHRRRLVAFIAACAAREGVVVDEAELERRIFPQQIYMPRPFHTLLGLA